MASQDSHNKDTDSYVAAGYVTVCVFGLERAASQRHCPFTSSVSQGKNHAGLSLKPLENHTECLRPSLVRRTTSLDQEHNVFMTHVA